MGYFNISNNYKAIIIGGSAGSFRLLLKILNNIPKDFSIPIIIVLHRLKSVRHGHAEALGIKSNKRITEPHDKEKIKKGHVYLAPSNYHLCIEPDGCFSLSTEEVVHNCRPSIDIAFESASDCFGENMIGILLSGANKDGAYGMKRIKDAGGVTIIQHPMESLIDTMPRAVMDVTNVNYVLKVENMIKFFHELHENTKSDPSQSPVL